MNNTFRSHLHGLQLIMWADNSVHRDATLVLDVTNLFQPTQRSKERLICPSITLALIISSGANGKQHPSPGSELQVFGLIQRLVVRFMVVL